MATHLPQLALGVAVQYALDLGMEWVWGRIQTLGAMLRSRLRAVPGVRIIDHGDVLCGIIGFSKVACVPALRIENLQAPFDEVYVSVFTAGKQASVEMSILKTVGLKGIYLLSQYILQPVPLQCTIFRDYSQPYTPSFLKDTTCRRAWTPRRRSQHCASCTASTSGRPAAA